MTDLSPRDFVVGVPLAVFFGAWMWCSIHQCMGFPKKRTNVGISATFCHPQYGCSMSAVSRFVLYP